jgi:Periplasmic copper-binding protein (NosD)
VGRPLRIRAAGGALSVLCAVLALPAVSAAATTDFVYGAGLSSAGTPFAFSARSDPDGSNPVGRAILGGIFGNAEGPITCLRVQGNLAVIGYRIEKATTPGLVGTGYVGTLQDNGAFTNGDPVDRGDAVPVSQAPTTCPAGNPANADYDLFGEAVVKDDSSLPPPPASPTWSISRGSIPSGGFYDNFNIGAMRIQDGSTVGYGTLAGPEGRPLSGRAICLSVNGQTAITGLETDHNHSLVSDDGAQVTSVDGSPDAVAITTVGEPEQVGDIECKPPYPTPQALTSGDVINRAGEALPPPPVRCGQTIRQSTTLKNDLDCFGLPYGIKIGAPGITLDLAGHSVHAHSASILNEGYDNVTIKNGSVLGSTRAIDLEGVSGNVVRDVSLTGLIDGITLSDSDHNRIVSNDLLSVAVIVQDGSDDNVIRGNRVRGWEGFIRIRKSSRNRVVENVSSTPQEVGVVVLQQADHTLVKGNHFDLTSGAGGVALFDSSDNQILSNVVQGHPNWDGSTSVVGVTLTGSHRNLMRRNSASNTATAIRVVSGWANELRRNQSLWSTSDGFLVGPDAVGTLLLRNTAFAAADDGFDIRAASSRLGHNAAAYSSGYGIRAVPGTVDLGGNQASNNRGPAQCLNIACS